MSPRPAALRQLEHAHALRVHPAQPRGASSTWVLWLIAASIAALSALQADPLASDERAQQAWPALPDPVASCDAGSDLAARRLAEAMRVARARMARYPFDPRDGLRALALLAEARDCAARAGMRDQDAALAAQRNAFRARILVDYRDHVTRLQRALAAKRPQRAARDVEFLLALLADQPSAMSPGLRGLRLELDDARAKDAR